MTKNITGMQTEKKIGKAITIIGQPPHMMEMDWAKKFMACMIFECTLDSHMRELIEMGHTTLYIGLSLVEDIILGDIITKIKVEHPHIYLIGVLEYEGVYLGWADSYQERYYQLIDKCDEVVELSQSYENDCEDQYKKYMVEHIDRLIFITDEINWYTSKIQMVNMAKKKGITLMYLDPMTLRWSVDLGRELRIVK